MELDEELIKLGSSVPYTGLSDQLEYTTALDQKEEGNLCEEGWVATDSQELHQVKAELEARKGEVIAERSDSKGLTRDEAEARSEAKAFKRKLDLKLPTFFEKNKVSGVTLADFNAGDKIGRSTPKLLTYFTKIRGNLTKIDVPLRPYFGNESAVALLDQHVKALGGAQGEQETTRAALPQGTREVRALMGRAVRLINQFNRAGKARYDGDALKRAMFNKDILLRAVRKQPKKDTAAA